MVFSSWFFLLVFLPLFYVAYVVAPLRWRVGVLLGFSLWFYCYGEGMGVFLLAGCGVVNGWLAQQVARATLPRTRRRWELVAVAANVGVLGWFKYAGFLAGSANAFWQGLGGGGSVLPVPQVALPLGISFFLFQGMSYVVDIYRGEAKAVGIGRTMTYLALFPQLVAGPIVRYRDVAEALACPRRVSLPSAMEGVRRFVIGLAKKVLLADALAVVADTAFATSSNALSFGMAWWGAIAYALQLYFDFSGYSDMAIGLGKTLGFTFPENFAYPYLATSIRDFWRRWHRSLSTWFRDYVYIPLGGSRCSARRVSLNLFCVFALTGLWHGASWTFVAWGMWHGLWIILERWLGERYEAVPGVCRRALTLMVVLVGWVLFRAEGFGHAGRYLSAMAGANGWGMEMGVLSCSWGIFAVMALAILACGDWQGVWGRLPNALRTLCAMGATVMLLLLCMGRIGAASHSPFLYFRF